MNESEFQKFAADNVCIGYPTVHAFFDFNGFNELLLDCTSPLNWAFVDHLDHLSRLFSIGELLVVELSRPDYPNFFSLICEQADQPKHARLGDQPEWKSHR